MENWQFIPAQNIGQPIHQQLKSARRENGLVGAITHLAWYFAVKASLKFFHRLSIEGRENLPDDGPFVLVANHASHLDALVLASAVSWRRQSRVFPVAAGDTFFAGRFSGTLSALILNALPMWRNRSCAHGLADLRQRLICEQCIYIIFPEGSRTRTGKMSPFRHGLGMLVADNAVPIVPCYLSGTFRAFPHHRRFPRPTKLRLTIGKPIAIDGVANERSGWESLTKMVESAVIKLRDGTAARTNS